ncbi:hypothetical protein MMC21_000836 [Puttea exsequens]|nr:hypothetical protein [Puttea exsequens]
MARERTPARTRPKSQLGDSYVVESDGDDGDSEYSTPYPPGTQADRTRQSPDGAETQMNKDATRRRSSRTNGRASADPDFIMPSIYEGSVGGSWLGEKKKRPRRSPIQGSRKPQVVRADEGRRSYQPQRAAQQDTLFQITQTAMHFVKPILVYVFDVLGGALYTLKTPIIYMVACWLIIGCLVFLQNLFFSSLYSALSPICRIPGASLFNLPMCESPVSVQYAGNEPPPVEFDQLMTVQNKFETVLQESASGVSLPLDMKRGETSIRDLRQVVRFSQLRSKNELVFEFDGFIETARIASYDLQKFNSHVGRGVDNILATARWTKRVLDGIAERDASQGAISWLVNDRILAPFQPIKFTEDAVLDQYLQHTHVVEEEINRLVTEAQALLLILQNLEDRLDVIHGIAIRDNLHAQGGKNEVLSQLWTMLGGNRNKLGKFDSQLRLLHEVNTYRQNAIAHVSGTLVRLQNIGAELEELRERVGGVELLGNKAGVPLCVHIENIEMGVERLERGRKGAKELENEELRKALDKGKGTDRMIEGS